MLGSFKAENISIAAIDRVGYKWNILGKTLDF
jgi:hypothetical protein